MEQSNKSPFINATGKNLLPDTVKEALKGLPYASQDGKYFDAKMQEKEKAMKLNLRRCLCSQRSELEESNLCSIPYRRQR